MKASESKAEAEAKRAAEVAALAPDKEKILAYAKSVWQVPVPTLSNPKSEKLIGDIRVNLQRFIAYVTNEANNL